VAVQAPQNGVAPVPSLADVIGRPHPPPNDPAWQPPRDPLIPTDELKARAGLISREIPLTVVATGWDVPSTRNALESLVVGLFDAPAQLVDAVIGDSRVQAAMASRTGGILGRPVDFVLPRRHADSDAAKECREAFVDAWDTMVPESILSQIQSWAVMIGFGPAQILWDTGGDYAIPRPLPWHPRYTYYHWMYRCYVAITLDGQEPILHGNGHWLNHCPHGEYRGWMHGAVRAISPWWLARNYALRDAARFSERHGLPMIKAKTPALGDPVIINQWRNALSGLGQETVLHLPQMVAPNASYDVELLEAKDTGHEGFINLIRQCDTEITLALLAQNLTTEVREGSMAAARVHADVRQSLLEADARALASTIYMQLARPFAAMNFGDPDLAPRVVWNVKPYEDDLTAVQTFMQFATSIFTLRNAGHAPKDIRRLALTFGLDLGDLEEVQPLAMATATAKSDADAAKAGAKEQAKLSEKEQRSAEARAIRFDPQLHARVERQRIRIAETSADLAEALAFAEAETDAIRAKMRPRTR